MQTRAFSHCYSKARQGWEGRHSAFKPLQEIQAGAETFVEHFSSSVSTVSGLTGSTFPHNLPVYIQIMLPN